MIAIGTSGYHFLEWVGPFYPKDLPKSDWLRYYTQHFSTLEINNTYYGLPKRETVERWSDETPDDFKYIIKLHQDTTHHRKNNGDEVKGFFDLFEPMTSSGKLKAVLAQFPASFHDTKESRNYLEKVVANCGNTQIFVEFRHRSWDNANAVEFCRNLNAGWVVVDLPDIYSLPGIRPAVTSTDSYVRFHGKNRSTWYNPERGDRYDWNYSEDDLRNWIKRIKALEERAETTYLFFNNCHAGQAVKNALLMRELLQNEFRIV